MDATKRNMPQARAAGVALAAVLALLLSTCKTGEAGASKPVDDSEVTAKIKAKLAADGDFTPFSIEVTTHQGVVTLEGRVQKDELKIKAERFASETAGVVRVINLVKVGDNR